MYLLSKNHHSRKNRGLSSIETAGLFLQIPDQAAKPLFRPCRFLLFVSLAFRRDKQDASVP
ncbi:hypothetical protein B4091_2354 [Bacillus licheniformis]|nr:hypothetical protein B4091_2354 [Bacillus licheniformis]